MGLVVTRQLEESIKVFDESGESIDIKLIQIKGKYVRLFVHAPKNFTIVRTENRTKGTKNETSNR